MLPVILISALLGLALLTLGLRGRRINDHPLCARCRFDLSGLVTPGTPATLPCPECGASLTAPGAIRTGQRVRRRSAIAAGSLLLLISASLGGALAWGSATAFNWNTIKPVWLLSRETASNDRAAADAAAAELLGRVRADKLSHKQLAAVVDRALDLQADADAHWPVALGDLIEHAWSRGMIRQEQIGLYARQATDALTMEFRQTTVAGSPWPILLTLPGGRAGNGVGIHLAERWDEILVGGVRVSQPASGFTGFFNVQSAGSGSMGYDYTLDVEPGEHEVRGRWTIRAVEGFDLKAEPLAEWTIERTGRVTVLPPDADLIRLRRDESLREQIRKAISIDRLEAYDYGRGLMANGMIQVRSAPIGLGFDVVWRVGDREWDAGKIAVQAGTNQGVGLHGELKGFDADTDVVTVILRPSVDAALRSLSVNEIWDGELIFPDMPVSWPHGRPAGKDAPTPPAPEDPR